MVSTQLMELMLAQSLLELSPVVYMPQTIAASVGDVANFGDLTSTAAGTAGSLAGTLDTAGAITVTAGGAGSSAIGQFVSEISIFD
jgi:hypothetical protein